LICPMHESLPKGGIGPGSHSGAQAGPTELQKRISKSLSATTITRLAWTYSGLSSLMRATLQRPTDGAGFFQAICFDSGNRFSYDRSHGEKAMAGAEHPAILKKRVVNYRRPDMPLVKTDLEKSGPHELSLEHAGLK
jgi:hypothetical protein